MRAHPALRRTCSVAVNAKVDDFCRGQRQSATTLAASRRRKLSQLVHGLLSHLLRGPWTRGLVDLVFFPVCPLGQGLRQSTHLSQLSL